MDCKKCRKARIYYGNIRKLIYGETITKHS